MKTIFTLLAASFLSFSSFASELFIKVNKAGTFYAMIGVQTHYNNSNTFRFFDLPQGLNEIKIYYNNTSDLIYSGSINLDYNQRVICEIDASGNLSIIQRQTVIIQNWYSSTVQSNYGNFDNQNVVNNGNSGYLEFIKLLKEESFDSGKFDKGKKYISKTTLSAQQISEIAALFSFDSNRLEWAKYAYQYCYDKQNYFLLKSSFSFSTNYSDLENFIEGK